MVLTEEDEVIIALCLIIMAVAMQNLEGRQVMRSSTGFLLRAIILLVFQYLCLKKRCLPCFCVKERDCSVFTPDNVISSA